jgi:GAF domain-containing protein
MTMSEPSTPVPAIDTDSFEYDRWRAKFLAAVLRIIAGLGLVIFLANLPILDRSEIGTFLVVYVVLLVVAFSTLPYALKASILIASGYLIGMFVIIQMGPWSAGTAYLLAANIFAALLFERGADRWMFTINLFSIAAVGTLNALGYLTLLAPVSRATGFSEWLSYLADYFFISGAVVWATYLLKSEFKTVAARFQTAVSMLSAQRAELEQRVEERTSGLRKKTDQLRAAAYIARQTAELNDLDTILKTVVNLITDQFGYYHAGIFLMNENRDEVILVAASSEGGKRMIEKGHSLKVGAEGIVGYVAAQKKPRIALDTGADPVFFNNPLLPLTRSEAAIPMIVQERVIGVLDIQSTQPSAFTPDDLDVLETLASQAAIAIEKTRLLEEAQTALYQIETLTAASTRATWQQRAQQGELAYTYTPLGVRSGRKLENEENLLQIPVTLRGQKIGLISIARKDNTPWSQFDRDMVQEVAYQTGLALENMRLIEEANQRSQQEQTVSELALRFSQVMDVDTLLQTAARELGQLPDVLEASVYIGDIPAQTPEKRRSRR